MRVDVADSHIITKKKLFCPKLTYRIEVSSYFGVRRTELHLGLHNTNATPALFTHYLRPHRNSFLTQEVTESRCWAELITS